MNARDYGVTVQQDQSDDWKAANDELDSRFLAAMASKDVDAAMSCFLDSPDLAVVLWGAEMLGPDQLRAALKGLFLSYDQITLDIDRLTEFPSGDAVIAVGQATFTLIKDKSVTKIREIWTDVRRKVEDRWVYVLDHAEVIH
jgi:ketosteroid isomerase-like protein